MQKKIQTALFAILICPVFCLAQDSKDNIQKQILSLVKNYCSAVESKNVNEVISYYSKSPEFMVYVNGKMNTYDEYVTQVKTVLPQLKKVNLSFDTLYIRNLGPNYVIAAGPFQEFMVDKEGKEMSFKIDVTWILIKQNNTYKLTYASGIYQPLNKGK
jgi:ketosteroid isomerase-like protein